MVTEILCRFDVGTQTPVVFLRDTINDGKIQVWSEGNKPEYKPLDYYGVTRHLSAADERALMERFKAATNRQDAVVRINHRLPRTPRPSVNLIATNDKGAQASQGGNKVEAPARTRRPAAKGVDDQPLPPGPQGDLPGPGEVPAGVTQAVSATPASILDELPSAALWRRIQELNERIQTLSTAHADLTQQLQNTATDLEATKTAAGQLVGEYNAAIEREAAEELQKRKLLIANMGLTIAPSPTSAQAPAPTPAPTEAPAAKTPAKTATKPPAKPAAKAPATTKKK
jgi:hypothetical protein